MQTLLMLVLATMLVASLIARDCHDTLPGFPWLGRVCERSSNGSTHIFPNKTVSPPSGPPSGPPGELPGDGDGDGDGGPGNGSGKGHGHGHGHDKDGKKH